MNYELDINEDFVNIKDLAQFNYKAICLNKDFTFGDKISDHKKIELNCSVYKKITLYLSEKNKRSTIKLPNHEILCVSCKDGTKPFFDFLCESYETDIISLDLHTPLFYFNESSVRKALRRNIFFEIKMKKILYNEKCHFLKNTQRFLNLTKGRNLLFSSNANVITEIKSMEDILCFLQLFDCKKKWIERIKENKERFLYTVACKKYLFKDCFGSEVYEGELKNDFIVKKFEGI
ncbi:RNase P subunit p30 [Tubulinosema ratisbonensis]|uniref:RNase P subunit p30 n=1 Tax=Tubulinosema ratisbonensis TaxID=291195 RepID=A0A437AIU5_9MICR|nr:RNase P subunit p30 [Tubulinosema ratisbonensis]